MAPRLAHQKRGIQTRRQAGDGRRTAHSIARPRDLHLSVRALAHGGRPNPDLAFRSLGRRVGNARGPRRLPPLRRDFRRIRERGSICPCRRSAHVGRKRQQRTNGHAMIVPRIPPLFRALLVLLLTTAAAPPPSGQATMAWHVTIPPAWFDPSTAPPQ